MARKKKDMDAPEEEPPKSKQGHLPEMEPPSIPEIDEAADRYVRLRNAWQAKHQPMMESQELLHGLLREHGLKRYEYDEMIVEVVIGEKVKVSKRKEDE